MTTENNLYNESNESTYCPEDNKLRLYIGRVPRDEFLELRKQGWTCTPKQPCDFVAHWRVEREQTALNYSGIIGDEDQSPTDRAADRAERFSGYLDKRREEAHTEADRFIQGPTVHGYQNQDKADRAAKKHDRIADRAVNQWSKAEYWQQRTAGVISNALYKIRPSVRMGRIKILESDERRYTESVNCGLNYKRALEHTQNRLDYEKSMIEASGGCAADLDLVVGGYLSGFQIHTINKSSASKKITSVKLINSNGSLKRINIERMEKPEYTAPTESDLEKLKAFKKAQKAELSKQPKKPSLLNPTLEDAQRLQDNWNKEANKRCLKHGCEDGHYSSDIVTMTQSECSARSKGSYSSVSTKYIGIDGNQTYRQYYGNTVEGAVFKIRYMTSGGTLYGACGTLYGAYRVVVITDKKQHELPEFKTLETEEV
jgi:hypothetical protein